jgi:hypothetical protein
MRCRISNVAQTPSPQDNPADSLLRPFFRAAKASRRTAEAPT